MAPLIRAELFRIRHTRLVYGLLAGQLSITILTVIGTAIQPHSKIGTSHGLAVLLTGASSGLVLSLVLGVLGLSGEFRHNTITHTFLATPVRHRVVAAKLFAYLIAGMLFGTCALAASAATGISVLAYRHAALPPLDTGIVLVAGGTVLASGLYSVAGVGLACLIRNQTAAVAVAALWVLVVEQIVVNLIPATWTWMPGAAAKSLIQGAITSGGVHLLPRAFGGLLLAAYGLLLAGLGTAFVVPRDVA